MHVHGHGARLVHDAQTGRERRHADRASAPVAVSEPAVQPHHDARGRAGDERTAHRVDVGLEAPEEFQAGVQPVPGPNRQLAGQDGVRVQQGPGRARIPQPLREALEPLLGRAAVQLAPEAGELQLRHERAVDGVRELCQQVPGQRPLDGLGVEARRAVADEGASPLAEPAASLGDERPDQVEESVRRPTEVMAGGPGVCRSQVFPPRRRVDAFDELGRPYAEDIPELVLADSGVREPARQSVPVRELRLGSPLGEAGARGLGVGVTAAGPGSTGAHERDPLIERERARPGCRSDRPPRFTCHKCPNCRTGSSSPRWSSRSRS